MYVNKQVLMGFLGKDPELKVTPSGTPVANCSLATKEVWKDASGQKKEETDWHNLTIWGKTGETFAQYAKKGSHVYIEGRTKQEKYTDKQSGLEKTATKVIVSFWKLLDKKDNDSAPRTNNAPASRGNNDSYDPSDYTPPSGGGTSYDDDVPF